MININPLFGRGDAFEPEAAAYFAALTTQPSDARKITINNLISGLKQDGVWSSLNILRVFAAHTVEAAKLNLIDPTYYPGAMNAAVFTPDKGWDNNESVALFSDFSVLQTTDRWTPTSGFMGIWQKTPGWSDKVCGNLNSGGAEYSLGGSTSYPSSGAYLTHQVYMRGYSISTGGSQSTNPSYFTTAYPYQDSVLFVGQLNSPANMALYLNGTLMTTNSGGSQIAGSDGRVIEYRPNSGHKARAFILGAPLTDTKQAALYSRLKTYMIDVGAG